MEPNPVLKCYDYFMTITFRNDPDSNISKAYEFTIHGIWNKLRKSTDFELYPELTIAGRIHYHVMLNITDKIKFYKSTLPKLKRDCGYVDIQGIKNLIACRDYCKKAVAIATDLFLDYDLNKVNFPVTNKTYRVGFRILQQQGYDALNFIDHVLIARRKIKEREEEVNLDNYTAICRGIRKEMLHEELGELEGDYYTKEHPQKNDWQTRIKAVQQLTARNRLKDGRDRTYKTVYDLYHTTA